MNLNKVFILGNVTRQPEVKALPSGQSVANFGLATNRFYKDSTGEKKQDTEFHNVVAFGKLADICSRYLNKGSLLFVEGRIKTRSWQGAAGTKQYKTEIIANNIQLGPRSMGGIMSSTAEESKNEDIPIIEESYNPPPVEKDTLQETQPEMIKEEEEEKEIDVKDIPF